VQREPVRLPVPELFTTNYDELIELAFRESGAEMEVSSTAEEFPVAPASASGSAPNQAPRNDLQARHDCPHGDDYAASRKSRAEMFEHLAHEVHYVSFLFVSFSLSDPNFNLIRDDARQAMEENASHAPLSPISAPRGLAVGCVESITQTRQAQLGQLGFDASAPSV
jgi:hypothetical protein